MLHTAAKGASQTERLAEYLQERRGRGQRPRRQGRHRQRESVCEQELRERGERAIESVEMHTLELAPAETTRDDPRLTRDLPETYPRLTRDLPETTRDDPRLT